MKSIRIILSIFLLIYSVPMVLSLLDIMQGTEPDLSAEWIILLTFIAISVFSAILTIVEALKAGRTERTE